MGHEAFSSGFLRRFFHRMLNGGELSWEDCFQAEEIARLPGKEGLE